MSDYIHQMLGDEEEILFVTHPHPFVFFQEIIIEVIFIVLILIGTSFALSLAPLTWIGYLLILIPLVSLAIKLIKFINHQFIITNRRVIQISGVMNKNVTDSSLEKVNDIKLTQSFLGRIFNYGDIEILTASEMGMNLFKQISKPIQFKTAMLNAREQMNFADQDSILPRGKSRQDIPELIAQLDDLRKIGVLSESEFQAKKEELLKKL